MYVVDTPMILYINLVMSRRGKFWGSGLHPQEVVAVWCQVLDRPRVGVNDNFFELGGHSLLLLQARTLLQRQLGREIQIVALFQNPTVATLARHLRDGARSPSAMLEEVAHRVGRRKDALRRRRESAQGDR